MTTATARLNPRVDRTRRAVLDTVRAILLEEGWDAVTHQRVAERSGVGRTTLYRHWPDKLQMVHDAILEESPTVHPVRTGDLRADLVGDLSDIVHQLVDQGVGVMLAGMIDRSEWDPALKRLKASFVAEALAALRKLLHQGQSSGQLRPDLDVDRGISELIGPIVYRRLVSGEPMGRSFVQAIVEDFLRAQSP